MFRRIDLPSSLGKKEEMTILLDPVAQAILDLWTDLCLPPLYLKMKEDPSFKTK
jgi:hypothetical protein